MTMTGCPSIVFPGTSIGLNLVSARTGEPVSSLDENGRYEYELLSPLYSLADVNGVVSRSRIRHDNERGLIEPGNYVGLL